MAWNFAAAPQKNGADPGFWVWAGWRCPRVGELNAIKKDEHHDAQIFRELNCQKKKKNKVPCHTYANLLLEITGVKKKKGEFSRNSESFLRVRRSR